MSDLYRDIVLDHWRMPRHAALIDGANHQATILNEQCGDQAAVALKIDEGKIRDVSIVVDGCALATASGSVLAEHLIGESIDNLKKLTDADIRHWLGGIDAITARINCIQLALITAKRAVIGSK